MSSTKLALQLYTVRQQLRENFITTFASLKDVGFEWFEPWDFVSMRSQLDQEKRSGVKFVAGHESLLRADTDRILNVANELDIPVVFEPFMTEENWSSAAAVEAMAERLNQVAKEAERFGIRVGYHNHFWEFEHAVGGQTAYDYFRQLLSPDIVLELDVYWAQVAGVAALPVIESLAGRPFMIHLKDGPLLHDLDHDQVILGEGAAEVYATICSALEAGAEAIVLELDAFAGDMLLAVNSSHQAAEKMIETATELPAV